MTYPDEEFLGKLREAFRGESEEHLLAISSGLLELEKSPEAAPGRKSSRISSATPTASKERPARSTFRK